MILCINTQTRFVFHLLDFHMLFTLFLAHNLNETKSGTSHVWCSFFRNIRSIYIYIDVKCGCKKKVPNIKLQMPSIRTFTSHYTHCTEKAKRKKQKQNRIAHNNNKIESNDKIIRICIFVMILCVCVFTTLA